MLKQVTSLRASSGAPARAGAGGEGIRVEDRALRRPQALIGREREVEEVKILVADPDVPLVTLARMGAR